MLRTGVALLLMLLPLSLAAATMRPRPTRVTLLVATWNMEWLVSPATAHAARQACRNGHRTTLPCDVARVHSRDSADFGRLAAYARQLDADVIAFQEVQDAAAAALVFGAYRICIATGRGLQHAGFAVRPGIAHRCGPQVNELSLGGSQRAGMTLVLHPDTPQAIELLSVHLKSGCADADLQSGASACSTLMSQAGQLAQWISARAGSRFILLGDFNRGDADVEGDEFWRTLTGGDPLAAHFRFANEGVPFRNCHIGAGFTRAIDHILVSRALHTAIVRLSFRKPGFRESDVLRYRLTDHCPVSFLLNPGISSAAVR